MAYESKSNLCRFEGAPSPWAVKLARHVAHELVMRGSGKAILPIDEPSSSRILMVLPKVSPDCIEVLVFYRPHLTGQRLSQLYYMHDYGNLLDLVKRWKDFGHAYVYFRILPRAVNPISFIGHHASIRAVDEMADMATARLPSLRAFDIALGSALEDSSNALGSLIADQVAKLGRSKSVMAAEGAP